MLMVGWEPRMHQNRVDGRSLRVACTTIAELSIEYSRFFKYPLPSRIGLPFRRPASTTRCRIEVEKKGYHTGREEGRRVVDS